ncbi:spondin-2-like [Corticium candelabrum]|uniref:spondin-2-like n=1 Tax=Corticium candelabrum TaxID=121492 RepID=UPI002E368028|nr:spondin-2-like [Corticium candelabrum]
MVRAELHALLLLAIISASFATYCPGRAVYKVSFQGEWQSGESPTTSGSGENVGKSSQQSHDFPQGAMFSPFAFASHNREYSMWRPRSMASKGVQDVAEKGDNAQLLEELETKKSQGEGVGYIKSHNKEVPASGEFVTYVSTDPYFPLVSFVSMLTPSPDWFIGVYNLDLCITEAMTWFKRRTVDLYAWDAGTDSGKNFTADDYPTDPQTNITLLKRSNDPMSSFHDSDGESEYIPRFGTIQFDLVNVTDGEQRVCRALGDQLYYFNFTGLWTQKNHPDLDIPKDANFSMAIVTSHSSEFVLWAPDTVDEESESTHGIASFEHGDFIAANGTSEAVLVINNDFHYISASAKLTPSPDWYIGISSINVCDGYFWKDELEFYLQPWDAGTHDGKTFVGQPDETKPQGIISRITTDTWGPFINPARQHIEPLGVIKLVRIRDPQKDYETFLQTWKSALNEYQDELEKWKAEECNAAE